MSFLQEKLECFIRKGNKQTPLWFILALVAGDLDVKHQTHTLFSEQFIKH